MYGVTPDLTCLGKIIGGGYALAAVAGNAALMELANPRRRNEADFVYMSGTLNGNPISAAAGNATIEVLDRPGSYERLFAAGERMRRGLADAFRAAGITVQVLGVGPVFQVAITNREISDYRSLRTADEVTGKQIAQRVFEQGYFYTGDKGYLSLVHTDEEIDATIAAFATALSAQP